MKIKNLIAGLLAGILMTGNLAAVCYAAGSTEVPDNDTTKAISDAPDEGAEDAALPEGYALGREIVLPEGVAISEDGNNSISAQGLEKAMAALTGTDSGGSADAPADTDTGAGTEAVSIGTVNVGSDTYLNLRTGPGMENQVIGHLLRGTELEVVGEDGDWYQVVLPETSGYVHKDYLTVTEQEAGAPPEDDSDASGGIDKDTLMLLLLLTMGMGNADSSAQDSNALTPDGNLTLMDDYKEENADGSGKQFITLVTKAGNTFYLVIDRDDEGEQTVHFMNLVDERDLLSLMDEDEAAEYAKPEPEEVPPAVTPEPEEQEEPEEPAKKSSPLPALLLVLALLGGGGFFAYTKFFKGSGKKDQVKPDPDADYTDEDEEDYGLPDDLGDDEDEAVNDFDAEDDEPV